VEKYINPPCAILDGGEGWYSWMILSCCSFSLPETGVSGMDVVEVVRRYAGILERADIHLKFTDLWVGEYGRVG